MLEETTAEFCMDKSKFISVTTDGANMVEAVRLFIGEYKRVSCMAHLLNLVVDGALKNNKVFLNLTNHVKSCYISNNQ